MAQLWFDENTHLLELLGLNDRRLEVGHANYWITTAIVTAEIVDEDDVQVWSGTLTYLGEIVSREIHGAPMTFADGNYRAAVPDTVAFSVKANGKRKRHIVKVDADDGTDRDGHWEDTISFGQRNFAELAS
jgi:hypothetical protein